MDKKQQKDINYNSFEEDMPSNCVSFFDPQSPLLSMSLNDLPGLPLLMSSLMININ